MKNTILPFLALSLIYTLVQTCKPLVDLASCYAKLGDTLVPITILT